MTVIKKETLLGGEELDPVAVDTFQEEVQDSIDTYLGEVTEDPTDTTEPDPVEEESPETESNSDADEEEVEEAPVAAVVKKEEKRPSRAKKRINQLLNDKKDLETKVEAARQEKAAAEAERNALVKQLADTNIKSTDLQIKSLKAQMVAAQDEGDTQKYVDLSENLASFQNQKNAFSEVASRFEEESVAAKASKEQPKNPAPTTHSETRQELVNEWIEKTPWFLTQDRLYNDPNYQPTEAHAKATKLVGQLEAGLVAEGYDVEDESFYEALDLRVSKVLKFYKLDKELEGAVQSEEQIDTPDVGSDNGAVNNIQKSDNSNDDENTDNLQKSTPPRPKVSGSTRTSGTSGKSPSNKTMTIDPLTRKIAEDFGYDPVEYAKMVQSNTTK